MKLAIIGGSKNQKIMDGIGESIYTNGDSLMAITSISDVKRILDRGDTFDRALVMQAGICEDNNDEIEIRRRVNAFSEEIASRSADIEVVFLAQDDDIASLIIDETYKISEKSIVISTKPPYRVAMLLSLLQTELQEIPADMIYKQEQHVSENNESSIDTEQIFDDMDIQDDYYKDTPQNDDIEDIFGDSIGENADVEVEENTEYENTGVVNEDVEDNISEHIDVESITDEDFVDEWQEDNQEDTQEDNELHQDSDMLYKDDSIKCDGSMYEDNSSKQDDTSAQYEYSGVDESLYSSNDEDYQYDNNENTQDRDNSLADMYDEHNKENESLYSEIEHEPLSSEAEQSAVGPISNENYVSNDANGINKKSRRGLRGIIHKASDKKVIQSKDEVIEIKEAIKPLANRGCGIVVTGCGGCGTSVVAFNLAKMIRKIGYTVLIVDCDTVGRTQSYISKRSFEGIERESSNLIAAINSGDIDGMVSIIEHGLHALTIDLGADIADISKVIDKNRMSRFVNIVKNRYNFIIYDIPFNEATGYMSDITLGADAIAITVDASNWGVTKFLVGMCNIENDDISQTLFARAKIVFNRYRNLNRLYGKKVSTATDILEIMDDKVQELIQEEAPLMFKNMKVAEVIDDDPDMEQYWGNDTSYIDKPEVLHKYTSIIKQLIIE